MKAKSPRRPHGQIRQSQIVTTFGPGSLVDLPTTSVLVGGLEFWSGLGSELREPRLTAKACELIGAPALRLYAPPAAMDDPRGAPSGITVFQFPEWFIVQASAEEERAGTAGRTRMLVHRGALTKGKYVGRDGKRRAVVPIRFVRACRRGHIGDIDWYGFVHEGAGECRRSLWIDERGTSGDISEVWVRCECGKQRPVSDAATAEFKALGPCDGTRPWLGVMSREMCDEINRLLVRTASNAYFPQILSVISLPDEDEPFAKAIDSIWEAYLQYVDSIEDLERERTKKPPVAKALAGYPNERVFDAIRKRRDAGPSAKLPPVKEAEIQVLTASGDELGSDAPDGDFFARALPRAVWDRPWTRTLQKVVRVHRLREVRALVGFSRFEPIGPDVSGDLDIGVRRAALSRETSWLPAIENRGEGIFLQWDKAAVDAWAAPSGVVARGKRLAAGFEVWREEHRGTKRQFPGLPYMMLHSLSHMLITGVALECGYPASSIRERIYAGPSGYGILLYTGTTDAEGTLGGLVEEGRRIERHLSSAIEIGRLCSNDPVCAQHDPVNELERRFLVGAACHGCLLIAETSCEMQNDFLDRALVIPTVDEVACAFFGGF
jgi:hypothetical protein